MRAPERNVLNSLDRVPEAGRDAVAWAMGELNARARTQSDILFELNDRLAAVGVDPISKSAFNRAAVRCYARRRRSEDHAAVLAITNENLDEQKIERTDMVLGEMIKMLVCEVIDAHEGGIDPQGTAFLARAFRDVKTAESLSRELQEKRQRQLEQTVDAATKAVGRARGLTAETIEQLRAEILGVKPAAQVETAQVETAQGRTA